jgi:hypothetical protein
MRKNMRMCVPVTRTCTIGKSKPSRKSDPFTNEETITSSFSLLYLLIKTHDG